MQIQGPYGHLLQKEFLSHTLKHEAAWLFLNYQKIIHEEDEEKKSTKPLSASVTRWAVVGPGERTLLPGHVREWGNHVVL